VPHQSLYSHKHIVDLHGDRGGGVNDGPSVRVIDPEQITDQLLLYGHPSLLDCNDTYTSDMASVRRSGEIIMYRGAAAGAEAR